MLDWLLRPDPVPNWLFVLMVAALVLAATKLVRRTDR